jgi:hypothetical protein
MFELDFLKVRTITYVRCLVFLFLHVDSYISSNFSGLSRGVPATPNSRPGNEGLEGAETKTTRGYERYRRGTDCRLGQEKETRRDCETDRLQKERRSPSNSFRLYGEETTTIDIEDTGTSFPKKRKISL